MKLRNDTLSVLTVLTLLVAAGSAASAAEPPTKFEAYTERISGTDVTFHMLPISGGKFLMGSPADEPGRKQNEGPQVEVAVDPFWMGKHEVTWAEYLPFMREHVTARDQRPEPELAEHVDAVTLPTPLFEIGIENYPGFPDEVKRPAVNMTHYAARQYTKWLSLKTGRFYRLPTEAEWEYAARADSAAAWSFGGDERLLPEYAWFWDNSEERSHPVGRKQPNAWSLHDMHGNVAEWVLDQYRSDAYQRLAPGGAARDPIVWPTQSYPHVVRGGSWLDDPDALRSAARDQSDHDFSMSDVQLPQSFTWHTDAEHVGFRVVRPLSPSDEPTKRRFWETADPQLRRDLKISNGQRDLRVPIPLREQPPGRQ